MVQRVRCEENVKILGFMWDVKNMWENCEKFGNDVICDKLVRKCEKVKF
jgi:hypothetical protein